MNQKMDMACLNAYKLGRASDEKLEALQKVLDRKKQMAELNLNPVTIGKSQMDSDYYAFR